MISDSQRSAKGIYGAGESRFGSTDHRHPVFDCSECGHVEMQMFDDLPVICRYEQQLRSFLTHLLNELREIHVIADGGSHPSVLRMTDWQATIARDTDPGFNSGH